MQRCCARLEASNAISKNESYSLFFECFFQRPDQGLIQQREHLRIALDEGDGLAEVNQLLGHFQPDEAGADDENLMGFLGGGFDAIGILQIPQGHDAGIFDTGHSWNERSCAGREDQLIVCERILRAAGHITHFDGLVDAIDGNRLGERAHIEIEQIAQALGVCTFSSARSLISPPM